MSDSERTANKTVVTVITTASSKPKEGRDACLVVIYGDDIGRRVPVGNRPCVIGRSSKCDVQLEHESVSRNHCRIAYSGSGYTVRDLGSTNGTYVNDVFVDESRLKDGDQIKVGRTILKFITGGNVEAQYHEEIYRLMTVDGLTEVHNKRFFHEMLDRETSRCARYDRTFSLIMLDIDHFKQINDTLGHLAGDAVLRQLGQLLKNRVRRDDIVARVGGEEFAVVLPEVGRKGAVDLASHLRALIEATDFRFEGAPVAVTMSLGVATWEPGIDSPEALVKAADAKLYEAKRSGRNRVCS